MKICIISSLYPPLAEGGATGIAKLVAEKLAEKRHEVFVITTSPNRTQYTEKINNVKIYRISPFNFYTFYNSYKNKKYPIILKAIWHLIDIWNLQSYFIVKNILKKEKPDVVHIHNFKGISSSVFSAIKSFGLALIFTAHDFSLICPRANLFKGSCNVCEDPSNLCKLYIEIQKLIVNNNLDFLTAPSDFVLDKLKESGLFEDVKTIKIPNTIELREEVVKKNYNTIDILYVGDLSEHKGVHILLKSFKKLKNENICLHILGKGRDEDEFKRIADSEQRIMFHGFLLGKELISFYQKANLTVVPSICYDNSPMVIYESFMNGTPVIASRIGGIPELIEEGYNGFLFEAGNSAELEKILEELIENHSMLKKLEKGAFESVKKYSMEKYVDKFEKIYKDLAGS